MYINFLHFIISFFDQPNKKKVLNFFKSKFQNNISVLVDVGAHHGETIKLFNETFIINSILSFEPSVRNYKKLHEKNKHFKNLKMFNLALGESKKNIDFMDHYESQSSTIIKINEKSKYYKKKFFFLNPFKDSNKKINLVKVKMDRLDNILKDLNIKIIDILKVDTEGYDFNVIKGLGDLLKNVKYIYFEHHFHDMLIKDYSLSDINEYLIKNNFKKVFKSKMKFRKTFEYIYFNKSH
tara:strand:- start:2598 stop:3311 length:714 start_codon:yes stop_codon:yes gene_type:complete